MIAKVIKFRLCLYGNKVINTLTGRGKTYFHLAAERVIIRALLNDFFVVYIVNLSAMCDSTFQN
jgi:replicative superfamily II helicase